jgi:hypothetical protein
MGDCFGFVNEPEFLLHCNRGVDEREGFLFMSW